MKEDIADAIKRNIPRQEKEARRGSPLSVLVFNWMKVAHDFSKDSRPAMREIWKKLEPILNKLSGEMAEKSPFKQNSIWHLDTYLYDKVLVESIGKRDGVFTFKPGSCNGTFLLESLTFPLNVDEMEFKDVVDWALAHDDKAYVPPSGEVFDGMFRRKW